MIDISPVTSALLVVAFLQFKHFICDGPLQTLAMVKSKSIYGAPLGLLHSALHGLGTAVVFLIAAFSPSVAIGLAVLDFAVHYHVDFTKENIIKYFGWNTNNAPFWWALSADQALHQFTYLLLYFLALKA
jgi:Protein of unknown function (DUF3307)